MAKLRLAQHPGSAPDSYRVEVCAEELDRLVSPVDVEFEFALAPQDYEDIRWYLEDYLLSSDKPAELIAQRIERRIVSIGEELFRAILQTTEDARDLWATIRPYLSDLHIEVTAGIAEATAVPWELIRDPRTGTALALSARSFVRGQRSAVTGFTPAGRPEKVRILLVICRPKANTDVPFRSVASRLIKGLSDDARAAFELNVLRPPTHEALARVLREANERGRPYHIVHFDGHGLYASPTALAKTGRVLCSPSSEARQTNHAVSCISSTQIAFKELNGCRGRIWPPAERYSGSCGGIECMPIRICSTTDEACRR